MRILVSGGSGFIGSHITERLIKDGHEVTITSTGSEPKISGVHKVLYPSLEGIDWRHVHGMDVVVHQFANNDTLCEDENELWRANFYGPIKLFSTAFDGGCKNFVYASSTAVYGNSPAPYVEGATEVKPLNKYGASKAKFDEFAMKFAEENKLRITGLRYCNVYGPGEDHKGKRMSMVGQLLRRMMKLKRPTLFTPGDQKRDWIYVKDVVEMNVKAMERAEETPWGRIYNCGNGTATSFNEVVATINNYLHTQMGIIVPLEPEYVTCPFAEAYQNHTECDITKARNELGFIPRYDLKTGVEEYFKSLNDSATCGS
jgi:ADP-L-glycero-D-manno-heptose 6-epimerase